MMRASLMALLMLGACKGGDDTDTDGLPATGDTDVTTGCGETVPTITEITLEDGGMSEGDQCGDEIVPMWLIQLEADDEDGDLTDYRMDVWFDKEVDGVVDDADDPASIEGTIDGDTCDVEKATIGMLLCVDGGAVDADTEYELLVVMYDAAGHASEAVITSGTTPAGP